MAVVRTKDPREAIVELMVAPGWEDDLEEVWKVSGRRYLLNLYRRPTEKLSARRMKLKVQS